MQILLVIPRVDSSGPVKGAFALAEYLKTEQVDVWIATLSERSHVDSYNEVDLGQGGWISRSLKLCWWLDCHADLTAVITYCLLPDVVLSVSRHRKKTFCFLRANNFENYRFQFGRLGILLAIFHTLTIRRSSHILCLNESQKQQLAKFGAKATVIPNFISERSLDRYEHNCLVNDVIKLLFVGGLNHRKNPLILVDIANALHLEGLEFELIIVGEGRLRKKLEQKITELRLENVVTLMGHLQDPFKIIKMCDVFIMPSYSEGTSRAALEALFFGLYTILRDVDSNSDLVRPGITGNCFTSKDELCAVLRTVIREKIRRRNKINLKSEFRQRVAGKRLMAELKAFEEGK